MQTEKAVAFHIGSLAKLIRRRLDSNLARRHSGLTGLQARIVCFIADAGRDVYQRDIEAELNVRRSTVSGVLRVMEKKGLIVRQDVAHDARLKKLVLTPRSKEQNQQMRRDIDELDRDLCRGISAEELQTFLTVVEKMKNNLANENGLSPGLEE